MKLKLIKLQAKCSSPFHAALALSLNHLAVFTVVFGLTFLFLPDLLSPSAYAPFHVISYKSWTTISVLIGILGLVGYYTRYACALVAFCFCATFLFSSAALLFAQSHVYTCTEIYFLLALAAGRQGGQILEKKSR